MAVKLIKKIQASIERKDEDRFRLSRAEAAKHAQERLERIAKLARLPFDEIDSELRVKQYIKVTRSRGGHLSPALYPEHRKLTPEEEKRVDKLVS